MIEHWSQLWLLALGTAIYNDINVLDQEVFQERCYHQMYVQSTLLKRSYYTFSQCCYILFILWYIIVNKIEICGIHISTLYELNPWHNLHWSNWRVLDIFTWWSFLWKYINLNMSTQTSHLRSSLWLAYYFFYTQSSCNRHPET